MKTTVSLPSRFAAAHRYLFDPATRHADRPGLVRCGVAATALLLFSPVGAVRAQNTHGVNMTNALWSGTSGWTVGPRLGNDESAGGSIFDSTTLNAKFPGLRTGSLAFAAVAADPSTAEDETPTPEQADVVATPMSPENKQMLMATLGLAGLLIGMERGCSWRLGVCQRRDQAAHKLLTPAVPLLPIIVPPLPAT